MSNGIGYLFCLLAACANGTFGVLHRVGGLWGIIVYEEIRGRDSIGLFCIGVVTMFTGIVLEAITRV